MVAQRNGSAWHVLRLIAFLALISSVGAAEGRADEEKAPYKVEVVELDTKAALLAVRAIDTKNCILVGEEGTMARSADAGKTWKLVKSGTTATLRDVRFVSPLVGLAVGDGGKYTVPNAKDPKYLSHIVAGFHVMNVEQCWSSILRTVDGGKKWERMEPPTNLWLLNVVWLDRQRALVTSGDLARDQPVDGGILATQDAGKTWKLLYVLGSPCRAIALTPDRQGWVVGDHGKKPAKFVHNGREIKGIKDLTPQEQVTLPADYRHSLVTPDTWNANAVYVGDATRPLNCDLLNADAVGIGTPEKDMLPTLFDVRIVNDRAWVVGEKGLLASAERKQKKWQPWKAADLEGDSTTLRSVAFRDKTGLAVGDQGCCWYTLDAGKTWKRLDTGTAVTLNGVQFMGADALIVGAEGTLLRLTAQK